MLNSWKSQDLCLKWSRTKLKFRKKREILGKNGQQIQNFQVILHLDVPLAPHRTTGNCPDVRLKDGTSGEISGKRRKFSRGGVNDVHVPVTWTVQSPYLREVCKVLELQKWSTRTYCSKIRPRTQSLIEEKDGYFQESKPWLYSLEVQGIQRIEFWDQRRPGSCQMDSLKIPPISEKVPVQKFWNCRNGLG